MVNSKLPRSRGVTKRTGEEVIPAGIGLINTLTEMNEFEFIKDQFLKGDWLINSWPDIYWVYGHTTRTYQCATKVSFPF